MKGLASIPITYQFIGIYHSRVKTHRLRFITPNTSNHRENDKQDIIELLVDVCLVTAKLSKCRWQRKKVQIKSSQSSHLENGSHIAYFIGHIILYL